MLARLTLEAGAAEPAMLDLLPGQIVNIGRNRSNTIVLLDPLASRFHAVVYLERDGWFVRDAGTGRSGSTNGTKIDGARIHASTRLADGQVIGIGAVRLRFHFLDPAKSRTDEVPSLSTLDEPQLLALTPAGPHPAVLHADELTALFQFMTASLEETTSHGLVVQALRVVERQTGAAVCGYLGFDADDPEPRVVTPAEAKMDVTLSKLLTQRAQSGLRTVWLADPHGDSLESPSLIAFRDAVCVPLRCHRGDRDAVAGDEVLGALHAYKTDGVFNDREVRFCEVLAGCLANTLSLLRGRRALEADVLRSRSTGLGDQLIGDSPAITNLRLEAARLAGARCPVLIEGETGVGKELVALALHRLGPRNAGPLVALNCAVVNSQLADAELFGHATGALGGSDRARPGVFEQADEGTLFLDEIGELSLESQARLLRVLETKSFRTVMGDAEIKVDVRVVAATNRDLEREVRAGRFRRDLFFRLGARIVVPPLREHMEDVPALAAYFLERLNAEYHRRATLSDEALQRLQNYTWPGNVRQLRSVLETGVAIAREDVLQPTDLLLVAEAVPAAGGPPSLNLEEVEAWAIREALAQTVGVQVQAARLLGIHRDTLINKMKKYGLSRPG